MAALSWGNVSAMVTARRRRTVPRQRPVYLREHRKDAGVSAAKMGEHLGMERESVLRLERKPDKSKSAMIVPYANALGKEPEDFWFLPGGRPKDDRPDLNEMFKDCDATTLKRAAEALKLLLGSGD